MVSVDVLGELQSCVVLSLLLPFDADDSGRGCCCLRCLSLPGARYGSVRREAKHRESRFDCVCSTGAELASWRVAISSHREGRR